MIKISRVKEYTNELCLHHSHSELEMNIFLGGSGTYWVNGVQYPVMSGDVFLFLSEMFHSLSIKNEQSGVDLIKVVFSLSDVELPGETGIYASLLEAVYLGGEKLNVRIPANSRCSQAIIRVADQMLRDRQDMLSQDGERYLLLYILNMVKFYHVSENGNTAGHFDVAAYNRVQNAMSYMDEHYMCDISIDEVGKAECFSVNRFTDAFKKYTGFTPKKYLIMKRIAGAASLIFENNLSMTEIAFNVGFNSTAAFNKAFLNVMGMTPTEYRKLLASTNDSRN